MKEAAGESFSVGYCHQPKGDLTIARDKPAGGARGNRSIADGPMMIDPYRS